MRSLSYVVIFMSLIANCQSGVTSCSLQQFIEDYILNPTNEILQECTSQRQLTDYAHNRYFNTSFFEGYFQSKTIDLKSFINIDIRVGFQFNSISNSLYTKLSTVCNKDKLDSEFAVA